MNANGNAQSAALTNSNLLLYSEDFDKASTGVGYCRVGGDVGEQRQANTQIVKKDSQVGGNPCWVDLTASQRATGRQRDGKLPP